MKGSKIVIKVGTSTLTEGTNKLSKRGMLRLVQQMAHLHSRGFLLLLVSSGAVASGREALDEKSEATKQACASVGQIKLMQIWSELFSLFDLQIGQVLLTKEDFSAQSAEFTKETIESLLASDIVPILNENDTVATKESRIGDNDNLAAMVAKLVHANLSILLTDREGLYTADPKANPRAKLIPIVSCIDEKIFALAKGTSTTLGTGGMITKLQAAQYASKAGIETIIASSFRHNVLVDLAEGKQIGTRFLCEK